MINKSRAEIWYMGFWVHHGSAEAEELLDSTSGQIHMWTASKLEMVKSQFDLGLAEDWPML